MKSNMVTPLHISVYQRLFGVSCVEVQQSSSSVQGNGLSHLPGKTNANSFFILRTHTKFISVRSKRSNTQ